jgi:hypothetical protein
MSSRSLGIPPLSGLASYVQAARIGYSVDASVRILQRLQWVDRRLMMVYLAHLPSTPEWEVKCAFALHQWQSCERASALRQRIGELRHPEPPLDRPPDESLDRFLDEVLRAWSTAELVAGIYTVVLPALGDAYRRYVAIANPLVDHPTCRVLRLGLPELDESVAWGAGALAAIARDEPSRGDVLSWQAHLHAYLEASGGIAGDGTARDGPLPPARATAPFVADTTPRRDARFHGTHDFDFPPHVIYNAPAVSAAERNLALLCKRTLEMDVPEMMASVMVERSDQPWEFFTDFSRQLWDEARHAMMGSVALEARGVDWTNIPLNIGFSLRLNRHAQPIERQMLLFAIEQSLMPADTGKRSEYQTALEAGDALSAHFHDFDWADEVLHAKIGRRLLRREGITPEDAMARAQAIHERTWAALERYRLREAPEEWWPGFVQQTLGIPAAGTIDRSAMPQVIAE